MIQLRHLRYFVGIVDAGSLSRAASTLFVAQPALSQQMADLEQRLRSRAQDSEEVVHQRMAKASDEISHYTEYDYIIINHEVDDSLVKLTAILQAARA